jgi:uncharacterized protein (TIGR01777 family)
VKTILITGGSGLIGRPLAKLLKAKGYKLILLSRGKVLPPNYDAVYTWDAENKRFDPRALDGVTGIIHLAGAGIAERRWTGNRKKEILESRTAPLKALHEALHKRGQHIECLISGSAVGWYGMKNDDVLHSETEPAAKDFLGETCRLWEEAAVAFSDCCKRIVTIRTGIVLDFEGGALQTIAKAVAFGLGAPLGSGKQQMPWIHINDMVAIFAEALENEKYVGPINATATENCSNSFFIQTLCRVMKRHYWPFGPPSFLLKMVLGEMSAVVLSGTRISNEKLHDLEFRFVYSDLKIALHDLIKKQTPVKQS